MAAMTSEQIEKGEDIFEIKSNLGNPLSWKKDCDQFNMFNQDGYVVLENFISIEDCDAMKKQLRHVIEKDLDLAQHPMTVFSSTKDAVFHTYDHYFMNSADKIRFFFEKDVIDEKGNLLREKHLSVNKVGHALHEIDPVFRRVTHLPQVQTLNDFEQYYTELTPKLQLTAQAAAAKSIGYEKPIIPQSMCIFKQPGVGGEVVPHQDGTFLHTEPKRVTGFWIAIEDADVDNGCLGFIPGSHKWPIPRRMIRNKADSGPATVFTGEEPDYDHSAFIDVPVKKGSCIIIHDHVVHKSEKNTSNRSRLIYTFHIAESHNTQWLPENWLQPTTTYKFPYLFD